MANEISINIGSLNYAKDVYNDSLAPGLIQLSVTGKHAVHDSTALSTSAAALPKGAIGTIGFFYVKNKDAAINALVSVGSTDFFTIPPGMVMIGYAGTVNINAKSASGTPLLESYLVEA